MTVSLGHCQLDVDAREVRWPERTEALTPIEARLLAYLVGRAGEIVGRRDVLTEVWGYHPESRTQTVGVIVRRLRHKIEITPGQPLLLRTVRGRGWMLVLPDAAAALVRTNLVVPRDRFFGRAGPLQTLGQDRLVTVVGPPGIGKTRLALQHAQNCVEGGEHGEVWIVPLAGATSADDVTARVADALGLFLGRPGGWAERVGRAIASRGRVLLVLDEAEAVGEDLARLVDGWLDQAPHARLLVTSRRRLRVPSERVLTLPPLTAAHGAALFVDRARARVPVDDDDPAVGLLVGELQGVPLAIELAAARVGLRSPATILDELRRRPERSGTTAPLSAALRWTCELLAPWERRAFAQTAVFGGGFDLDAARAVLDVGADHTAEGAVLALVDWSLLRRRAPAREGAPVRFDSLAFVADFARGLLGPDDPAVVRHADHYAALGSDRFQRSLHERDGLARRARVQDERANLARGARRGAAADAVACARALASHTDLVGPVTEGIDALQSVLDRDDLDPLDRFRASVALAQSLTKGGRTAEALRALERSRDLDLPDVPPLWRARQAHVTFAVVHRTADGDAIGAAREALATASASGDLKEISIAEMNLGNALVDLGAWSEARDLHDRALEHARQVGDRRGEAYVLGLIATHGLQRSEPDALERLLEAQRLAEEAGDRYTVGWLTTSVISALNWAGRHEEALEAAEAGIQLNAELGVASLEAVCRGNLASTLLELGEVDEACALLEVAIEAMREAAWPMGEGAFLAELAEGRARRGEDATALALQAIDVLERHGTPTSLAMAWVQRGSVALWLGDRPTAEAALARSFEIAGEQTRAGLDRGRAALRERLQG